jgi:signal transduction histidine kinase
MPAVNDPDTENSFRIERDRVDSALVGDEDSVERLLAEERLETDRFIETQKETNRIDSARSASSLKQEKAAHEVTKRAVTTRDQFLAIVSHDLRNPIGAISSCAEMLLEDESYKSNLIPDLEHWIRFIKRNAENALRLISELLDMERLVDGRLSLNLKENDVLELTRETVEDFVYEAAARSILLRFVPDTLDVRKVVCDADRIHQVLGNLIGNALKFTPESGSVSVRLKATPRDFVFSVCDSGPGIPAEMRSKIFDRFVQLENRNRTGLGLGLYISKMLIEAHHGSIWMNDSETSGGSVFSFSLPKSGSNALSKDEKKTLI